jgi:hypothetical protein
VLECLLYGDVRIVEDIGILDLDTIPREYVLCLILLELELPVMLEYLHSLHDEILDVLSSLLIIHLLQVVALEVVPKLRLLVLLK